MKKFHFFLIVLLSIFLMPSSAMACGKTNAAKKSCSMEINSKSKKDCCSSKSTSKSEKQKSCSGKCGDSICTTFSITLSCILTSVSSFEIEENILNFRSDRQKIYSSVSKTLDGYSSLWLIPKIS